MTSPAQRSAVTTAMVVVVAGVIGYGLFLSGSPGEERLRRLDERRVQDLQDLERWTKLYHTREGKLPATLSDLSVVSVDSASFSDPLTDKMYRYRVVSDSTFELCAIFARRSEEPARGMGDPFWRHEAGEHCFLSSITKRVTFLPEQHFDWQLGRGP